MGSTGWASTGCGSPVGEGLTGNLSKVRNPAIGSEVLAAPAM